MYKGKFTLDYPKTVWKKCRGRDNSISIVELEIPAGSTVIEPYKKLYVLNKKCRTDKAVVKKIYTIYANIDETTQYSPLPFESLFLIEDPQITKTYSICEPEFKYEVGKTVQVDDLDTDPFHVCGAGINFFCTLREAVFWGNINYPLEFSSLDVHIGKEQHCSGTLVKVPAKKQKK